MGNAAGLWPILTVRNDASRPSPAFFSDATLRCVPTARGSVVGHPPKTKALCSYVMECTAQDVLTDLKKQYLLGKLMDEATQSISPPKTPSPPILSPLEPHSPI